MSEPVRESDRKDTTPGLRADDTAPLLDLDPPSSTGDPAPSVEETERAIQDAASGSKAGTNLDTLIGRLVVEQGLATSDEVKYALTLGRTEEGEAGKSLTQILVDKSFVTSRQLARLREVIEAERSGQTIPGYKILGKLGSGAMASVYKAKQISLDRLVAIKKLPEKFSKNPQFIERFFAEGRAAAQLNHPNIVQAFDVGNEGEIYYFVMEYVVGRTVHDDIVKHKRYGEKEAVEIVIQVAEALEHAHARGLIHRDVKPKNIMIAKEGVVKLADMGLARAISDKEAAEAEAGKAFGTPYYISPEQIRGEVNIGPPADIYALGATLYHMVTGSVPYEAKSPSEVMRKHLKSELVPPDHVNPKLSAGVSEVVEMMMAKDPRKRYQTCTDLLVDLRALREGELPPIAHRDVLADDQLASLAAAEASVQTAIPEDSSQVGGKRQIGEMVTWPPFVVLVVLLLLSMAWNIGSWVL
ncbi:MAG: serine/threonine-protein kinase [Phycisphaerales bacterium]